MNLLYSFMSPVPGPQASEQSAGSEGQKENGARTLNLSYNIVTMSLELWIDGVGGKEVIGTHQFSDNGHDLPPDGVCWPYPGADGYSIGLHVPGNADVSVIIVLKHREVVTRLAAFRPAGMAGHFMIGFAPLDSQLQSVIVTR